MSSSPTQVAERSAEIARILETESDLKEFQQHVEEVLHGEAFRGSQRSGQFLRYIIDQSIAGHCDELKERLIGIELFGRSPTYDTGEDAIVRVTASDVRRRLLQHYGAHGAEAGFRIRLPLGSYIPEIARDLTLKANASEDTKVESLAKETIVSLVPLPVLTQEQPPAPTAQEKTPSLSRPSWTGRFGTRWIMAAACCMAIAVVALFAVRFATRATREQSDSLWGALFGFQLSTKLITSDPNIVEIQSLTGQAVTLSDYANQRYIPHPEKVTPQVVTLSTDTLRGDKAASVDTGVAVNVAEWMDAAKAGHLTVQSARNLRFADLLKDGNFVLVGSPRSNPWALYYNEHLDFRFVFDQGSGQEIVEDVHPHRGEPTQYVPTAKGFATGQSFAVASYLRNPDHQGHILLIAGADAEGTEAVAELMTNSAELSAAMSQCGLPLSAPIPNFQLLLRLSTMAGSPSHSDVIACHILT